MSVTRVLVYGGRGALGAKCVSAFKANKYWVISVDLNENCEADVNIILNKDAHIIQQEETVKTSVSQALNGTVLDAIFCVAGGWMGGNALKDLAKSADLMWRQSVASSLVSATVAAHHLKPGGLLVLTGAKAALEATPGMIGYGVAKAAVHHLTTSLAAKNSGLPQGSIVTAILPITLDTPMNRKSMPKADTSTWTPLEFVVNLFVDWIFGNRPPTNGSLLQLITKNSETSVVPI